jgi:DNA-directed RNA polymerase specialized sigma24 family protein
MVSISRPVPVDAQEAVSALYQQHWVGLLRLAVLMVDDRPAAEDVVQEAFAELYRRWPLRGPDAALAYLRTAVVNRSRSGATSSRGLAALTERLKELR